MKNKVNVDQCNIDTDDREKEFAAKKSLGYEKDYAKNRFDWSNNPDNNIVADFPLHVDVEFSSICNLSCPMCPTGTEEFKAKVPRAYVDPVLFKKIIDECAENNLYSLRLSWIGEPTLHPKFLELLRYAKEKGIKEVSMLTHGKKFINWEFCEKVIDAGIDYITISIDGINETYEEIRKPIKFPQIVQALRNISEIKKSKNLIKPAIKIQGVWPAVKKDLEEYLKIFTPLTDLIYTNPLIDYLQLDDPDSIEYVDNFTCYQLFQRVVVRSNGLTAMCSNDDVSGHVTGDANRMTIKEIWHGQEFKRIRDLHIAHKGHLEIRGCKRCHVPRARETEEVIVNDRRIFIENYKARVQIIGR